MGFAHRYQMMPFQGFYFPPFKCFCNNSRSSHLASAASFAVGAALPLAVTALVPQHNLLQWIAFSTLVFLALLGLIAAKAGDTNLLASAWRVTFWGAVAMAITAGAGALFGAVQ